MSRQQTTDQHSLLDRRLAAMAQSYQLFYDDPLQFVKGEGVWLIDEKGDRYLDCYNNVPSVGHSHSHVASAISQQAKTLSTNTRYLHEGIVQYTDRLLATMPNTIERAVFTCTGSEAIDLAVRVANLTTGRQGIIVTENAYHGVTKTVSEFSPSLIKTIGLPSHVVTVPVPKSSSEGERQKFAHATELAIQTLRSRDFNVALMVVDSILSSDGVRPHPAGFLKDAMDVVHKHGGLFLADEVQSGFGRTGEFLWGFDRHGIHPDFVALGKPMGNGFPVAALALRDDLAKEFADNMRYFNTYGGNTVAIAAASAVLDVVEQEQLQNNARVVGKTLLDGLDEIAAQYDLIKEVRGVGLFAGVDIVDQSGAPDPQLAHDIVQRLRAKKVLIAATGPTRNVLKIRPPLVLSHGNVEFFLDRFHEVISAHG